MSAQQRHGAPATDPEARLTELMLALVPADGSTIGNTKLRRSVEAALATEGLMLSDDDYWRVHAELVAQGMLLKGAGRGGSVRRASPPVAAKAASADPDPPVSPGDLADGEDGFALQAQAAAPPVSPSAPQMEKPAAAKPAPVRAKAGTRLTAADGVPQIISYRHADRRVNNPEVGMVTPATDPDQKKTRWRYDPHLDPALAFDPQRARIEALIGDALESGDADRMRAALEELKRLQSPYLDWAGKAERTAFDVDTVSLHVHERIDPASILSAVRKAMQTEGRPRGADRAVQPGLFDAPFENLPLRDAIDFYRHERGWANRLVAGDSLLVMNSLLQKENMAGRVQMIYIDPPYGIRYGSNFQPFVGKRDVKDRSDSDLTQEPEMIKAFRDTWELGIHSYLTYLRDRLLLARELLHESGSVFVQISDENLHHVREVMDEVFGSPNFVSVICVSKTSAVNSPQARTNTLAGVTDFLVWYAKSGAAIKYRPLYREKETAKSFDGVFKYVELADGRRLAVSDKRGRTADGEVAGRLYALGDSTSQKPTTVFDFNLQGRIFHPGSRGWRTTEVGMRRAAHINRWVSVNSNLRYVSFASDFPVIALNDFWEDTGTGSFLDAKVYVVQTGAKIIERCLLMTTDPGDLVLDPTCGSGTTAFVAEKWGRRWITCDTSRVAVTLARQRLMTASYDYYSLKYPHEGLKGGFVYKTVPHVTLKSIANNPEIDAIHERMHPAIMQALAALNAALRASPPAPFTVTEGARKGRAVDFSLPPEITERLPAGDEVPAGALLEWEVPFDFLETWPDAAREPFDAFHAARQSMQRQMDASIAAHADQETLYDQPAVEKRRLRITGPFTVEAVPFPSVKSLDEAGEPAEADASIARTGESGRQHQWRDELLKTGIRGKGGQMLKFADLEPLPADMNIRHLHASGRLDSGERVVVSFGPEHAALEQRQVVQALGEASDLFPVPKMIVFCAFTFDPEAAKDIDALKGIVALKAQMNTDLLTEDLKKARASNQSFWLMGQPEVEVRRAKAGKGERWEVEVHGFDYFDTVKGELVSGGKSRIAMWALDTDYDDRSLFPRQVFFPMAGKGEGWDKLRRDLRAELDENRLQAFQGTVSLPFDAGENRKIAVKIVDDRGIESLKVVSLDAFLP